ncbi:MAG: threonine synthase [Candidatus Bathyarchaeota archaeon]|nr:MAG: threonine synthase [Candidatus Bathyarchaeota archaeon]
MVSLGAKCSKCQSAFSSDVALTICPECGGALLLEYDLAQVTEQISKTILERRDDTFWKYIELLPLASDGVISLQEPYTPVSPLSDRFDKAFKNAYIKDDGRLPTGTFKARGMAVAVSCLRELGVRRVAVPSAGNAAAALAAYGAKAGLEVYAFMPKDVPDSNLKESIFSGAKVYLVDGLIDDASRIVQTLQQKYKWFNISTNRQPYRLEGYKAMAFEIAEQFKWDPPDNILFPTGGGEGIIGLWKGFNELLNLGWTNKIPRLVAVQSSGCAPLVEAIVKHKSAVDEAWRHAETIAAGLRIPFPYASYLILRAIRETEGTAVAVDDTEIAASMKDFFKLGIYACPEAASTLAALRDLRGDRILGRDETALLCMTGTALKHFHLLAVERSEVPILSRQADSL